MKKAEAKRIIEANKSNTAWYGENNIDIFGENIATTEALYNMFRFRYSFGEAETQCLIAALVLSGAKIEG